MWKTKIIYEKLLVDLPQYKNKHEIKTKLDISIH